jgi:DNA-directed RNA polymerase subunit RPC12/RpoP
MAKNQMLRSVNPTPAQRRWNPYICQDCRAIFRVPSDYEGTGVVCPKCDRMMRLPKPGEVVADEANFGTMHAVTADSDVSVSTAPESTLWDSTDPHFADPPPHENREVAPSSISPAPSITESITRKGEPMRRRKKHRRKSDADANEWQDHSERRGHDLSSESSRWVIGGVIALGFALLLLVASLATHLGPKKVVAPIKPVVIELPNITHANPVFDRTKYLTEISAIESVIRKFLQARTPDEMLLHVRQTPHIKDRVLAYYQKHSFQMPGFSKIDDESVDLSTDGKMFTASVVTNVFSKTGIAVLEEDHGYLVDWESWVGWSEMSFEELMKEKPTTPVELRVSVESENYYNFDFPPEDERLWQSYRLVAPDGVLFLHGYVKKASDLDNDLRLSPDQTVKNVILRIKYPEKSTNQKQVLIDSIVADGWLKLDAPK